MRPYIPKNPSIPNSKKNKKKSQLAPFNRFQG
jgi:hypothetical protein